MVSQYGFRFLLDKRTSNECLVINAGTGEFGLLNYVIDSITVSLGNSGKVPIQFSHLTWLAVCKDLGPPLTLEHFHIVRSL